MESTYKNIGLLPVELNLDNKMHYILSSPPFRVIVSMYQDFDIVSRPYEPPFVTITRKEDNPTYIYIYLLHEKKRS